MEIDSAVPAAEEISGRRMLLRMQLMTRSGGLSESCHLDEEVRVSYWSDAAAAGGVAAVGGVVAGVVAVVFD